MKTKKEINLITEFNAYDIYQTKKRIDDINEKIKYLEKIKEKYGKRLKEITKK